MRCGGDPGAATGVCAPLRANVYADGGTLTPPFGVDFDEAGAFAEVAVGTATSSWQTLFVTATDKCAATSARVGWATAST